jgi:hypothetical protein
MITKFASGSNYVDPGSVQRDGKRYRLCADAVADSRGRNPIIGGMIFIDVFGRDVIGHRPSPTPRFH